MPESIPVQTSAWISVKQCSKPWNSEPIAWISTNWCMNQCETVSKTVKQWTLNKLVRESGWNNVQNRETVNPCLLNAWINTNWCVNQCETVFKTVKQWTPACWMLESVQTSAWISVKQCLVRESVWNSETVNSCLLNAWISTNQCMITVKVVKQRTHAAYEKPSWKLVFYVWCTIFWRQIYVWCTTPLWLHTICFYEFAT